MEVIGYACVVWTNEVHINIYPSTVSASLCKWKPLIRTNELHVYIVKKLQSHCQQHICFSTRSCWMLLSNQIFGHGGEWVEVITVVTVGY